MAILQALFLTLFIETLVFLLLRRKEVKLYVSVFLLNLVLNPTMNFLLLAAASKESYDLILYSFEVGTVLIETLAIYLIMKTPLFKTFLVTLLANALSYLGGLVFFALPLSPPWPFVLTLLLAFSYFIVLSGLSYLAYFARKENNPSLDESL